MAESQPIPAGVAPRTLLQHDTDLAVKPGFRAPKNTKSKAMKKPAAKKKKK